MRIGLDFDRVLFDTDRFQEDLYQELGLKYTEENVYDENGNYDPEKHARAFNVNPEQLWEEIEGLEKYIFDDTEVLNRMKGHELVLVSRGNRKFQKKKIEASGIEEIFDEVHVVEKGTKNRFNLDALFDDSPEELEGVENGFLIDRPKKGLEWALQKVVELQGRKVFKRYDIRGKQPEEIDEAFAKRLGEALSAFAGSWAVCRDAKESSRRLKDALIEGLESGGAAVIDVGEGPTDYLAFASSRKGVHGVQVTSSHLPVEFNGFKLVYPEGTSFVNEDLSRVESLFMDSRSGSGEASKSQVSVEEEYLDAALEFLEGFDLETDREVFVDTMAGSSRLPEVLKRLGFDVTVADHEEMPDPPRPSKKYLEGLPQGYDVVLANDLDADRIAVAGDRVFSGQELLLVVLDLFPGKGVVSVDTSMEAEKVSHVERTRVGDPFVLNKAVEAGAEVSGEPNGHYAFTEFVPYDSGTLAGALFAGLNLESRLERLPDVDVEKRSFRAEDKHGLIEEVLEGLTEEEVVSRADGVRFRWGDGEILARPSGTSPKVRFYAESPGDPTELLDDALEELGIDPGV